MRAQPELGLRLALTIGRNVRVQQALLDNRRGKPVVGPAEDIDLHRGWGPGEAEGAEQPPAGHVVGVGQLAHVHRPARTCRRGPRAPRSPRRRPGPTGRPRPRRWRSARKSPSVRPTAAAAGNRRPGGCVPAAARPARRSTAAGGLSRFSPRGLSQFSPQRKWDCPLWAVSRGPGCQPAVGLRFGAVRAGWQPAPPTPAGWQPAPPARGYIP